MVQERRSICGETLEYFVLLLMYILTFDQFDLCMTRLSVSSPTITRGLSVVMIKFLLPA